MEKPIYPHTITLKEIETARQIFEDREPRDLFYRVATEVIELALHGATSLSVAESVAVLLQTWNRNFYRFTPFDSQHFSEIERLINDHSSILALIRQRSIESLSDEDQAVVMEAFPSFEEVLGPVGAAKCLHLLAPRFFPLWDVAIAKGYGLALKKKGQNTERYYQLMKAVKGQCKRLGGEKGIGRNPLKAIDEYNYCKYTLLDARLG